MQYLCALIEGGEGVLEGTLYKAIVSINEFVSEDGGEERM
jgi:hypothetical protein